MVMAMAFPSLPLPFAARPIPPHCHRSPSRPLVCCQLFQRRLPGLWTKFVKFLARPNQVSDTGSIGYSRLEDPSPGNSSSSLLEPKLWPRLFKSLVRPKKNSHREGKGKDGLTDPISGNGSSRGLERCGKDRWRRPKGLLVWNSREVREIWALLLQLGVVLLFTRFTGLLVLPTARTERRIGHSTESTSNVPFSEFLCRVQQGHVQSVEIDGVHFRYSLCFTQPPRQELQVGSTDLESNVSREKYDYRVFLDPGGDFLALQPFCYDQVNTRSILYTTIKPYDMVTPYERMIKNGVDFQVPDKRATNFINSFGLLCLYVGLLATMSIQRFSSVLQSTAWPLRGRRFYKRGMKKAKKDSITFADVAGIDEAKEELEEVVDYLRNPQRYSRLGASPPRGVLLVGPPGTGKTLLARAVSGEADVPFISCAGSEFVEMYVGMGASRVRELFAKAKEEAPSIIFIDEIDAVAKGRDGRMLGFASDEREQTLNQLLTELDGFERSSMVIVLAATNRADVLDPALKRPGRFDRVVMVDPPDKLGREKVLQVHVSKKQVPLAENVDLEMVAAATSGFTGADLANLVNEAALLAGRANKDKVFKEDFLCAVERAIGGIEKKRSMLHSKEKGVVARHEVGHAVVGTAIANLLPRHGRVQKLSILPRTGGALGFTYSPPASEDRYLMFVDELRGRLVTLLGGRAAEEVIYHGRVSTGALDDIRQATDMAYKAIAEYGLNSLIGPVSLATLSGGGLDSAGSAFPRANGQGPVIDLVQTEVRSLLQSALSMALIVIRSNPTILEGLGAQLEANDKVEGETLQQWLNQVVAPDEHCTYVGANAHPSCIKSANIDNCKEKSEGTLLAQEDDAKEDGQLHKQTLRILKKKVKDDQEDDAKEDGQLHKQTLRILKKKVKDGQEDDAKEDGQLHKQTLRILKKKVKELS